MIATLYLDLGNSQTRLMVKVGDTVSNVHVLPNEFARIPSDYDVPAAYLDTDSVIFEYDGSRYATGQLAYREFGPYLIRPSAMEPKYSSMVTPLTLRAAFIQALKLVELDPGESVDAWEVRLLCPPIQTARSQDFEDLVRDCKKITQIFPVERTHVINVRSVRVMAEAISAFFAVAFNPNRTLRDGMDVLKNSSVLIMDVGAGTTDVCVIQGFKAVEESRDTYPLGGNNVHQQVARALKLKGMSYSAARVAEASVSGYIEDGADVVDIRDDIEAVKAKLAVALRNDLRSSFESSLIDPRSIKYLLVVGGGSLEGATTPLGEHLLKAVRELAPNISLLTIPEDLNPRHLNILGASIL